LGSTQRFSNLLLLVVVPVVASSAPAQNPFYLEYNLSLHWPATIPATGKPRDGQSGAAVVAVSSVCACQLFG
jgi:hypothetical protein